MQPPGSPAGLSLDPPCLPAENERTCVTWLRGFACRFTKTIPIWKPFPMGRRMEFLPARGSRGHVTPIPVSGPEPASPGRTSVPRSLLSVTGRPRESAASAVSPWGSPHAPVRQSCAQFRSLARMLPPSSFSFLSAPLVWNQAAGLCARGRWERLGRKSRPGRFPGPASFSRTAQPIY